MGIVVKKKEKNENKQVKENISTSHLKRTIFVNKGEHITEHIVLGTAHISNKSVEEVRETIELEKPDVIAIELCESRLHKLVNPENWKEMNIFEVIKTKNVYLFLLNMYLANIQKKLGEKVGIMPGQEMIEAYNIAKEKNIPVILADRDIQITFKKAISALSFFEKMKLMYFFFLSFFSSDEIDKETVEAMKKEDSISKAISLMVKEFPKLKETLVDDRDRYIAKKLGESTAGKVLTIVGAGHLSGIEKNLTLKEFENYSYNSLTTIKQKRKIGLLKWLIPILFLFFIIYGFNTKGTGVGVNLLLLWFLLHGILASLGCIIGGAKFITILTAFIVAPFTALNPFIGAGWVAGLVEVMANKPKVMDFLALNSIGFSLKKLRGNKVSKILLIVALSNLGSIIASVIALPIMASLVF